MDNLKLDAFSSKNIKTYYNKLQTAEQKNWLQDQWNLHAFLRLSPDIMYTIKDLEKEETFECALCLLFHERNRQKTEYVWISPHINCDKLLKVVADTIASKLIIEEVQLKQCITDCQPLWVFIILMLPSLGCH